MRESTIFVILIKDEWSFVVFQLQNMLYFKLIFSLDHHFEYCNNIYYKCKQIYNTEQPCC